MISSSTTLLLLLAGISLLLLNDIHGSSSLKIFVNANEILDELDRPGGGNGFLEAAGTISLSGVPV